MKNIKFKIIAFLWICMATAAFLASFAAAQTYSPNRSGITASSPAPSATASPTKPPTTACTGEKLAAAFAAAGGVFPKPGRNSHELYLTLVENTQGEVIAGIYSDYHKGVRLMPGVPPPGPHVVTSSAKIPATSLPAECLPAAH